MTDWEPATDAELAMRDALRTDDQESYFRILAGLDLLLPVSADAIAGLVPLGWGAWSTGGRTHVLAFTSPSALQACLADYTGSARRISYQDLANTWPNLEWWLAVNPGLPIEGYLPAWFVAQLARGDLRLPARPAERDQAGASGNDNAAVPPPAQRPPPCPLPLPPRPARPPRTARRRGPPRAACRCARRVARLRTCRPGTPRPLPLSRRRRRPPSRPPPHRPFPHRSPRRRPLPCRRRTGCPRRCRRPRRWGPRRRRPPNTALRPLPDQRAQAQQQAQARQQAEPHQQATAHVPAAPRPADPGAPPSAAPVQPTPGGPLPRRPVTSPSERPTSMAAAAQAIASARVPQPAPQAPAGGFAPPVIPGSPARPRAAARDVDPPAGSRQLRRAAVPQPASRPVIPPASSGSARFGSDATAGGPGRRVPARQRGRAGPLRRRRRRQHRRLPLHAAAGHGPRTGRRGLAAGHPARRRPGFAFRTEDYDGECHLVVFTSPDRLADHHAGAGPHRRRPVLPADPQLARRVLGVRRQPGQPGRRETARCADRRAGQLGDRGGARHRRRCRRRRTGRRTGAGAAGPADAAQPPTIMQKTRAARTRSTTSSTGATTGSPASCTGPARSSTCVRPADLHGALGLGYAGSPYQADAKEVFVLRWPALPAEPLPDPVRRAERTGDARDGRLGDRAGRRSAATASRPARGRT